MSDKTWKSEEEAYFEQMWEEILPKLLSVNEQRLKEMEMHGGQLIRQSFLAGEMPDFDLPAPETGWLLHYSANPPGISETRWYPDMEAALAGVADPLAVDDLRARIAEGQGRVSDQTPEGSTGSLRWELEELGVSEAPWKPQPITLYDSANEAKSTFCEAPPGWWTVAVYDEDREHEAAFAFFDEETARTFAVDDFDIKVFEPGVTPNFLRNIIDDFRNGFRSAQIVGTERAGFQATAPN